MLFCIYCKYRTDIGKMKFYDTQGSVKTPYQWAIVGVSGLTKFASKTLIRGQPFDV